MRKVQSFVAVIGVIALLVGCSKAPKKPPKPKTPQTAEAAVKAVVDGLQNNKPVVLWDALPASYQKDLNSLAQSAAAKADPKLWNAGWELFRKLVTVAKDKRDMILSSEMMAGAKKTVKMDELKKNWDVVVDLLGTIANCDLGKVEKAKTIDMGKLMSTTGAELMQKAQKLSQVMPPDKMQDNPWVMLKTVKVTTVKPDKKAKPDANMATLKIEGGGQPAEVFEFIKVEGKWIPMELKAFWTREMAKAKKELAAVKKQDPKEVEQALGMITALNNAMDTVIAAKTQEQFNMGLSQLLGPFMMMGGGGQPGGPGGGMPPPAPKE